MTQMPASEAPLRDELRQVREQHMVLVEEHAKVVRQNAALVEENKLLREKVDLLVKRIFGAKSEKLSPEQLTLLLSGFEEPKKDPASCASSGALEAELDKAPARRPRKAREHEARVPQHLPAIEEFIDPQEVLAAPEKWRQIGEEITEQLDFERARFIRRLLIRRKYVERDNSYSAPIIAPLSTLQERSIAGVGLIAHIIVSKLCDHLPLYRLEQIFAARHAIRVPRQSMARWMVMAADWLRPIYEQIRISVFEGGYAQVDETPVEYLCPGHGETKLGYFWVAKRPGADVVFHWSLTRGTEGLEELVPESFTGTLQCDGYVAYPAFARKHEGIILAGCLAHARRNFVDAKKGEAKQHACWVLLQIQHLYRIEQRLREQRAGPRLREAVRASESRPIMKRLYKALSRMSQRHLPQGTMGKAISYALEHWDRLCVYLGDGRMEIDNNLVENAIRPTAIGKKNWLFIGAAEAGGSTAILYTIMESCRRRGLDPYAYLCDVLTRLPVMKTGQIKEVMPGVWGKDRALQQRKAA